jgi:uncharacterized membrane protein
MLKTIEKSIEINAPVRAVYEQWTHFEDFPRFMKGIEEVRQIDDKHLHWRAHVGGKPLEWDAEIVDQVPDQVISWRSTTGKPNAGTVRFDKIDNDHTRVRLTMELEPETGVEKVGAAIGVPSHRVQQDLERFKDLIEGRRH